MATVAEELSKAVADVAASVAPSVVGVGAGGSGVVVRTGSWSPTPTTSGTTRWWSPSPTAGGPRAAPPGSTWTVTWRWWRWTPETPPRWRPAGRRPRHGRRRAGPGQPGGAGRTGERGLRLGARRGVPGSRWPARARRHRAHRAARAWIVGRARGRRSTAGSSASTPTAWVTASTWRSPRGRRCSSRVDALARGEVPRRLRLGIAVRTPVWRAGFVSRSGSPSATGFSSTPSRRAARRPGRAAPGDLIVRVGTRRHDRRRARRDLRRRGVRRRGRARRAGDRRAHRAGGPRRRATRDRLVTDVSVVVRSPLGS